MQNILWSPRHQTGIEAIDQQHRSLFLAFDELWKITADHRLGTPWPPYLGIFLSQLGGFARTHFAFEEQLMADHGYPGLTAHRLQHQQLAARLAACQERCADSAMSEDQQADLEELLAFLGDWLEHHILEQDQAYVPFLRERGVR